MGKIVLAVVILFALAAYNQHLNTSIAPDSPAIINGKVQATPTASGSSATNPLRLAIAGELANPDESHPLDFIGQVKLLTDGSISIVPLWVRNTANTPLD